MLQQQGERSERRFNKGTSVAKNNKNVQSGPVYDLLLELKKYFENKV